MEEKIGLHDKVHINDFIHRISIAKEGITLPRRTGKVTVIEEQTLINIKSISVKVTIMVIEKNKDYHLSFLSSPLLRICPLPFILIIITDKNRRAIQSLTAGTFN